MWRLCVAYWISKPKRASMSALVHPPTHTPTLTRAYAHTHRNMQHLLLSTVTVVSQTRLCYVTLPPLFKILAHFSNPKFILMSLPIAFTSFNSFSKSSSLT